MTQRLYYEDAYIKEFDAKVLRCTPLVNGFETVLDRTAFYPGGGGQPCDLGTLGNVNVLEVKYGSEEILHICDGPLRPESQAHGEIDWERRLAFMREHSGEHIISGIICKTHGCSNVGFHMGKDCVTIDFSKLLTDEEIAAAEWAANKKVLENVDIHACFPDPETLETLEYRSKKELDGAVRIVTVPGADTCACCGTHVRRTGEIGPIKVTGSEHYKNGIRLNILIGEKALSDYAQKYENLRRISALLSVKPENAGDAVEKLLDSVNALKLEYGALKMQMLEQRAANIGGGEKAAVLFEQGLTPVDVRKLADRLQERVSFAAVFCGTDREGYKYVICGRGMDITGLGKEFNRALNGRGGGKNPMIQGSVSARRDEIEAFFKMKELL